ncbi:hypothetical protein ACIBG5_43030 [Kribbella sp. NPDC050241]|uniref:hypothetical protein n=1 Tax=Kribbella sp. NPDC050241 TaxID=3364115 RepID=UPI0037AE3A88
MTQPIQRSLLCSRGPHFETSQASSNSGTSRAIASNAPGTAGVRSIAAVSPEKNDVSPDPDDPSMMTRPISIPNRFIPQGSPAAALQQN